NEALLRYLLDK
nr:Chain B, Peptide from Nuclear receptor coactivator [Homo sapiens]